MADYKRVRRIGELIQREISRLLQREIKDPRVKSISISAVEVNRDLSTAKVYFTLFNTGKFDTQNSDSKISDSELKDKISQAQQGLNKASGFIRHLLGQQIQIRSVPQLRFVYDESIIRGANMSQLIDELIAKDNKNHVDDPDVDIQDTDNSDNSN